MCYDKLGDKDKLQESVQVALKFYPEYLIKHPEDARAHLFYAMDLSTAGKIEEAKREATKAIELNPTDLLMQYNTACFYSQLGDKKHAIETLKKAVSSGYKAYDWIKHDPDLDILRDEPEFIELMKGN